GHWRRAEHEAEADQQADRRAGPGDDRKRRPRAERRVEFVDVLIPACRNRSGDREAPDEVLQKPFALSRRRGPVRKSSNDEECNEQSHARERSSCVPTEPLNYADFERGSRRSRPRNDNPGGSMALSVGRPADRRQLLSLGATIGPGGGS